MAGIPAIARAARAARRLAPLATEAYRRWQALPDEKKEQYKNQARGYAERGRKVAGDAISKAQQQRRKRP